MMVEPPGWVDSGPCSRGSIVEDGVVDRVLIEREIARILAEMGIREERLSPTACLLQDFRIDGDDAVEFFEAVSTRFGTDLTVLGKDWASHFGPEGLSIAPVGRILVGAAGAGAAAVLAGLRPFICVVLVGVGAWRLGRSGGAPAPCPIRLSDVMDAVERGRWERSGG